jgi:hypothetical protein
MKLDVFNSFPTASELHRLETGVLYAVCTSILRVM